MMVVVMTVIDRAWSIVHLLGVHLVDVELGRRWGVVAMMVVTTVSGSRRLRRTVVAVMMVVTTVSGSRRRRRTVVAVMMMVVPACSVDLLLVGDDVEQRSVVTTVSGSRR
jgi:hypothetical protein